MKIVVLGTGDMTKIPRFTDVSAEDLNNIISELGEVIAKKGHELIIIPDEGVPIEVAKAYKENGGKKVIGFVPVNDKTFGVDYIQEFLPILDEKIEVNDWYDASGEIAASGDICIVLGVSPGIMAEIGYLKYHYKKLGCKTKLYWLKKTLSAPIHKELDEELNINYVDSVRDLEKVL